MASDRTAQRLSRILSMLPWVIEHDGSDIDDLVSRFGYRSKADLVKDLHLVFMTGLPGYGPGDLIDVDIFENEVYVDAADYFSRPLRLTAPEALGLLAAGMTFVQSEHAPAALISAVDKLKTAVVPDADSLVYFDVPTPDAVATLKAAIERDHVSRITYVALATNERTVRDVEGNAVVFNLGNWYLTGYCRLAEAERAFRVDRIAHVDELDETYDAPTTRENQIVQYRPSDGDAHVSFTTDSSSSWVSEYYPVDARELGDGSLRITMSVSDPLVAARLLIKLGEHVTEIAGSEVVDAMEDLRRRIVARYAPSQ